MPTITVSAPRSFVIRNAAKRPGGERIEHVERGDVDDHATSAITADQVGQVVAELNQVLIGQRRLDTGDEGLTLFENRNGHSSRSW